MEQIQQRPKEWANPTPAGLTALAVACYCFFAMLSGMVKVEASLIMGIWLLGGFVVQLVVALLDLKSGNTAGGNAFLYFCAFFMLVSGGGMIAKHLCLIHNVALDARIDGWAWVALTLVTYLFTPAFLKANKCLFFVIIFLDIALPFIALKDLGVLPGALAIIPAVSLLISGTIAIYLTGAIVINTTFNKTVLPTGKPFVA